MKARRQFALGLGLLFVGLLWLACGTPARTQYMLMTGAGKAPGAAAAYTGPGDLGSWTEWGGLRAFSAATRGTKSINVCNVGDVVCADLSTDATTGMLVVTTVGGSSCSVVTCTVQTMYDKAGTANDWTQPVIASRPTLQTNAIGSFACLKFVPTQSFVGTNPLALTQPYSLSAVANRNGATTTQGTIIQDNGNSTGLYYNSSANSGFVYAGTVGAATITDNAFHGLNAVVNGASSTLRVDTTSNSVAAGAQTLPDATQIGTGAGDLTALLCEVGVAPSDISSFIVALAAQQKSVWGY